MAIFPSPSVILEGSAVVASATPSFTSSFLHASTLLLPEEVTLSAVRASDASGRAIPADACNALALLVSCVRRGLETDAPLVERPSAAKGELGSSVDENSVRVSELQEFQTAAWAHLYWHAAVFARSLKTWRWMAAVSSVERIPAAIDSVFADAGVSLGSPSRHTA